MSAVAGCPRASWRGGGARRGAGGHLTLVSCCPAQERAPYPGRGLGTDTLGAARSPAVFLSPRLWPTSLEREENLFLIVNCAIANWLLSCAEQSQAPEGPEEPGWMATEPRFRGPKRGFGNVTM